MLPHGNRCRDRSSGQSRWAFDRKRKTWSDHDAHHCALPRDDTRDRHANIRLRLTKADFEEEHVGHSVVEFLPTITVELRDMLCYVCKCNDATVFLTQNLEGKMHKVN